jgi:glycosyltransferase involved in cell wall biosynthesis
MLKQPPPPEQGSGSSDGVLDPLVGVFQQALSLKFFHVGSGHHDADTCTPSLPPNVEGEHAGGSSRNFSSNVEHPKVAILLATYQGQKYLAEQLASFAAQTHHNWEVWASDDGSQDDTHTILEQYEKHWPFGRLSIHNGPAEGFAANFLSLTCKANIAADYYAYADQDDVWEDDKLERAVQCLQAVPAHIPALYCGRTLLVDQHNREIGFSCLHHKAPTFQNALVQTIAGANTIVFNNAARALLQEAGERIPVVSHDWWAYMLVSGCGGRVFYDAKATLRYRQHENNLVGMNASWPARFKRIRMLWQGRFKQWNDSNIVALESMAHRLTPESRSVLEQFAAARKMGLLPRLIHLKRSGIYRQRLLGNLGLIAAAVFRKL